MMTSAPSSVASLSFSSVMSTAALHLGRAAGAYRPPLGSLGQAVDRAILHRVADATVRTFLIRVAAQLADQPVINPKLRPVRQAILGLTWGFYWLAGWRSGYFRVSGIEVPIRSKASC
jgi:hypothetical protein